MNRLIKIFSPAAAAAIIMSLAACNNYDLLNQLESPGKSTNNTGGFISLYLFSTSTPINGNIKGAFATAREGADAQCLGTRAGITFPNNGCNQVRAVISLSASDSIGNMPLNYGVPTNRSINASNNFVIAPDWNALRDGTSGNSLAPNVMPAATTWWSFSTTGGNFDGTNNCSGGGNGSSFSGVAADSSVTGANWVTGSALICSGSYRLLCICY
ncbi:MAG TPA: hypothetical protein PKG67_03040 [Turneriella sp.]|nr:hypothetical protein [Turneriella sp.]HNM99396.1 hypothetical protein [Turneriella sp.]